ncbi:MAG: hypothetical protein CME62_06790 [Halobacteriovoraceae bacterium]|nr:hypothetical protein [Halobacteriovoraceae bacterium]|tara:strand:+ start:1557 stop:1958 length:402 start_codon:yes stop_codon:yes gene_type:complete
MDSHRLTDQKIINWDRIHKQLLADLNINNFLNLYNNTEANLLEIEVQANIYCPQIQRDKIRKVTAYLYGHLELIERGTLALKNASPSIQNNNEQFRMDLYDELSQINEKTLQVLKHIQSRYSDKRDLESFYLS